MRKFCLLVAFFSIAAISSQIDLYSQAIRWSALGRATTPSPFDEIEAVNTPDRAQISTGYYFVDNQAGSTYTRWMPRANPDGSTNRLLPLTYEPNLWFRIYPGPRSVPAREFESGIEGMREGLAGEGWDKVRILPPTETGKTPVEGYRYFRNPAQYDKYSDRLYTGSDIDSASHAFAGPIPIGFAFYMNGIRYDSFYVSTCGVIALSNRRYLYDADGNRAIPPNKTDCYDPMSADWPFTIDGLATSDPEAVGQGRVHRVTGGESTNEISEPTLDNYGFVYIACGGDPSNRAAGIRTPIENLYRAGNPQNQNAPPSTGPSIMVRTEGGAPGAAYITPFEGPFFLPQWDHVTGRSDDAGQVYYKRSTGSDRLIIYYRNFQVLPGKYVLESNQGNVTYTVPGTDVRDAGRPGAVDVVSGSCQVELNRTDSSITFRYGEFQGNIAGAAGYGAGVVATANAFIQPWASIAVGGYARHKSYNSKEASTWERSETEPWGGQYMQFTQQYNGWPGDTVAIIQQNTNLITSQYQIKFKQWKNALRLVDIQYFVKSKALTSDLFNIEIRTTEVQDTYNPFELLAGHDRLGHLQPVGIVQNLTNDIQSPTGVNFVKQDFQFQAQMRITNRITEKIIYNRAAKVADSCLRRWDWGEKGTAKYTTAENYCGGAGVELNYSKVTKPQQNYEVVPYDESVYNEEGRDGIPPYGFVQVRFPIFSPNENIKEQLGLMELTAFTDAVNPATGARTGDDWPFDDSSKVNFWVISRVNAFRSNGDFHFAPSLGIIPDVTQWVHSSFVINNSSVQVVQSDPNSSLNPVPPLGMTSSLNSNAPASLNSPMYKFVWANVNQKSVGAKLTSFPVDMRNKQGSVLTLAVQRNVASAPTNRGFSDQQLVGPEPMVPFNEVWNNVDNNWSKADNLGNAGITLDPDFDYLAVEYLKPSPDGVNNISMTGGQPVTNTNANDAFYEADGAQNTGTNAMWRYHPVNGRYQTPIGNVHTHTPALAIFGGGGHFVGWTFANGRDYHAANWNGNAGWGGNDLYGGRGIVTVKRNLAQRDWTYLDGVSFTAADSVVAGMIANPYDVGFDYEFYRYSVVIPSYFMEAGPDYGRNFRFRIKLIENNTDGGTGDNMAQNNPPNPSDDDDPYLVDNVAVMTPSNPIDLEAQAIKIVWPYAKIPASQATNLNIIGRIANMGVADAAPFSVKIRVFKGNLQSSGEMPADRAVYCHSLSIPQLLKGQSMEVTAPSFSAREFADMNNGINRFTIQMIIYTNNADLYTTNDTVFSNIELNFGDEFAYVNSTTNDVETGMGANIAGKGLNLWGTRFGGYINAAPPNGVNRMTDAVLLARATAPFNGMYLNYWNPWGLPWLGYVSGGNLDDQLLGHPTFEYHSGQIAVKFELNSTDTIRGVRARFAKANQDFDGVSFNIYSDANGVPGPQVVNPNLPLFGRRLMAKAANGTETFVGTDAPVLYEFAAPIRLDRGVYWVSIDQRGETGLELAATGESMGMRTMLLSANTRDVAGYGNIGVLGESGIQLLVDKRLRVPTNLPPFGRVYVNNNLFAYKNTLNSSNPWYQFMPTSGQVAYPHLNHYGMVSGAYNNYRTFTRGTWAPLLTPYFGTKTIAPDNNAHPCPDDNIDGSDQAINLTSFSGFVRNNAVELVWETASEVNNHSFIVERLELGSDTWEEVNNVAGAGNTNISHTYRLRDDNVVSGQTYKYRLYNMSVDGVISCENNNIITVEYLGGNEIVLGQNSPNPFDGETHIDVTIPEAQNVTLEILDIFGKVVTTLVNNETLKGTYKYTWNGRDANGLSVADGHYIYKLTTGNEIITKKMSLIRTR